MPVIMYRTLKAVFKSLKSLKLVHYPLRGQRRVSTRLPAAICGPLRGAIWGYPQEVPAVKANAKGTAPRRLQA